MKTSKVGEIKYCQFESFQKEGIEHGIFMRHGGCSPAPWKSLNLSTTVGDSRENVIENRRRVLSSLHLNQDNYFDVWQVHSSEIIITEKNKASDQAYIKADAIITSSSGVALLMRFADCVPIMLFDPRKKVIALVHAGWLGTLEMIAYKSVQKMENVFGSYRQDVIAGIGPSICVTHYPVGKKVIDKLISVFPDNWMDFVKKYDERLHLDLWKLNKYILERAGINKIEVSEICTACDKNNWFSHRGEEGNTGRFAGIITIL